MFAKGSVKKGSFMNKKEISEIKKQITPANCAITRICGCYVNAEKEKVTTFKDAFLSLPEEEMFKYFDIFRKVLSGTQGKNLLNMEFPLESEAEGGTQSFLLELRDSKLQDEELLDKYYDAIIESYTYGENYLILIIHAAYDIPGKASDETEMFDSSDEVYEYIISCICPVSLSKPALSYDAQEQCFHNRIRDWIVDLPHLGFLFPAFNDRSTDLHSLLYYSKSAEDLHFDFTERLLGCQLPLPASDQKDIFTDLVEEALGDDCAYEIVQNLHEQIHNLTVSQKDSPDPVMLGQTDVKNLLELSGADKEQLDRFDAAFEEAAGKDARFLASNITGTRKYEVRTPDVVIQVSPDRADLVEQRLIEGRLCLVIPVTDQVHVNGIRVTNQLLKEENP